MRLQKLVAMPATTANTYPKASAGLDDHLPFRTKRASRYVLSVSAKDGANKASKKPVGAPQRHLRLVNDKVNFRPEIDVVSSLEPVPGGHDREDYNGVTTVRQNLLRVAVDVDEVLGSFLSSLNRFISEKHLLTYDLSEYHVYDFMKIWGCSQAEANDRVHAFFESEHFKDGIAPIPGALKSLVQLADFCDLVVVT
ncbi:hypothetical protein KP509_24G055200 [Ceratopteris richardii]|nr:hypothetical protein KP509_24G055200 [Ceratopteris richardii]